MEGMPWLPFAKQFVLVLFFTLFSGILIWTYYPGNRDLEQLRDMPLEDAKQGGWCDE